MSVISRYLNRMFFTRLAVVGFAVLGFATVLDLVDVVDDLAISPEGPLLAGLRYVALRLPLMISELLPICALVAGLLMVGDLMRHRELAVLWGSGITPYQLMSFLVPAILILIGLRLVVEDRAVPYAAQQLRAWGIGDFKHHAEEGEAGGFYWLRNGNDVIRLSANAVSVGELLELTIFDRDAEGLLLERIDAKEAQTVPGGIELVDVIRRKVGAGRAEKVDQLFWPAPIDVNRVALLARPARELSLGELIEVLRAGAYGMRADEPYATWLHLRIAGSLVPPLLLLVAVGLARRFERTASIAPVFITAVATGFTFLILGGVLSALGEVGIVPPVIAAWLPTLGLAVLVLFLAQGRHRLRAVPATWRTA